MLTHVLAEPWAMSVQLLGHSTACRHQPCLRMYAVLETILFAPARFHVGLVVHVRQEPVHTQCAGDWSGQKLQQAGVAST
jgi:hypothetical protein